MCENDSFGFEMCNCSKEEKTLRPTVSKKSTTSAIEAFRRQRKKEQIKAKLSLQRKNIPFMEEGTILVNTSGFFFVVSGKMTPAGKYRVVPVKRTTDIVYHGIHAEFTCKLVIENGCACPTDEKDFLIRYTGDGWWFGNRSTLKQHNPHEIFVC